MKVAAENRYDRDVFAILMDVNSDPSVITEAVLSTALANHHYARRHLDLLAHLEHDLPIRHAVMQVAAKCRLDLLIRLCQWKPDISVTEEMMFDIVNDYLQHFESGILEQLKQHRPDLPITEAVLMGAAKNRTYGRLIMQHLKQWRPDTPITQTVVERAARTGLSALSMLQEWKPDISIENMVVEISAAHHDAAMILPELKRWRPDLAITDTVVQNAAKGENGKDVLLLLKEWRPDITVTASLVREAAGITNRA